MAFDFSKHTNKTAAAPTAVAEPPRAVAIDPRAILAGMNESQAAEDDPFLPTGEHELEILSCSIFRSTDPMKGNVTMSKVRFKMEASNNPHSTIGGSYVYLQKLEGAARAPGLKTLKSLVLAAAPTIPAIMESLAGIPEKQQLQTIFEASEDIFASACDEETQILRGGKLGAVVVNKPIKSKPGQTGDFPTFRALTKK